MVRAFTPWFVLEKRLGIGVTVPPSAAEPWISQQPHLLGAVEVLDRGLAGHWRCWATTYFINFVGPPPHERHVSPASTM
jgi:hypothetical protein